MRSLFANRKILIIQITSATVKKFFDIYFRKNYIHRIDCTYARNCVTSPDVTLPLNGSFNCKYDACPVVMKAGVSPSAIKCIPSGNNKKGYSSSFIISIYNRFSTLQCFTDGVTASY